MIKVCLRDITTFDDVDVIVNASKKSLLGGGGVDGAIHYVAGFELDEACRKLGGCETGEAKLTKGYNLKVPYIIHTVGPIHYKEEWAKVHNYDQAGLLKKCYVNSLNLAKENGLKKIVFPAISTGAYDYPVPEATAIAINTCISFLKDNPEFEITFCLFEQHIYDEYVKQLKEFNII